MRRCVWSRNLKNEENIVRVGPQRHREKENQIVYMVTTLLLPFNNEPAVFHLPHRVGKSSIDIYLERIPNIGWSLAAKRDINGNMYSVQGSALKG